ncbi:kinase-like domain-containing protein [Zychaea mexicana]|uniref:kinase-like domain-containing protein n=1 Tax=Zychaea mexicana TaxID=64656 RepID=UPI0022FF08B3|nr:kinase-like domain-containing protein [Zychaea mexicana]KAI9487955.1 kinase-like domain-containing protein [Zychaea mexicana]
MNNRKTHSHSKDQPAANDHVPGVSAPPTEIDRSEYYTPALTSRERLSSLSQSGQQQPPVVDNSLSSGNKIVSSTYSATRRHTTELQQKQPPITTVTHGQESSSNHSRDREGGGEEEERKNPSNGKEAIALKDEPNKRTPVMVTPESTLSSDISCSSSIELVENIEFPYIDDGTPDILLRQEPETVKVERPKGFRPFVRANSMSSSSGSVATVTVNSIRRKRKGPLYCLTVNLKKTYEIIDPEFGYTGRSDPRRVLTRPSKPAKNDGFDNENSDYIIRVHDVLGAPGNDQYRVIDLLGSGTFGQVVKCEHLSTHEFVSVKIIKNKREYRLQSDLEAGILKQLHRKLQPRDREYILKLHDTFDHKNHLCIVSELLSFSLYDLLIQNKLMGMPLHLVRSFSIRIIETLGLLREAKFIHCDLKPENILLKSVDSSEIKVVDFGAACHEAGKKYLYIQSRFYRSPEVILGLPYSYPIDMWSAGCVIAEMFLGVPLFPGSSEHNQLRRIIDMLGSPPPDMLQRGSKTKHFFNQKTVNDQDRPTIYRMKSQDQYSREKNIVSVPSRQYLPEMGLTDLILNYPNPSLSYADDDRDQEIKLRRSLADFLKGLLTVDPEIRWTPKQAREHPFITGEPYTGPYVPVKELSRNTSTDSASSSGDKNGNNCTAAKFTTLKAVAEDALKGDITATTTTTTEAVTHSNTTIKTNEGILPRVTAAIAEQQSQQQQRPHQMQQELPEKQPIATTTKIPVTSVTTPAQPPVFAPAPVKGKVLARVATSPQRQDPKAAPASATITTGNAQQPGPTPILLNGKKSQLYPVNGNRMANTLGGGDGGHNKRNIIIMPEATTAATTLSASASSSTHGHSSFAAVSNPVIETLRMHYKHDGSPAGAVCLTSPPILTTTATVTTDAVNNNNNNNNNNYDYSNIKYTNNSNNNDNSSSNNHSNGNKKSNHSEPDISRRVKIAPYVKLRCGSHDSFRMPDEIHYNYGSTTTGTVRATGGAGTATTLLSGLYQHDNASRVKLNSVDSTGSRDNSDTSDITPSKSRMAARHAGEAAGGLLMMRDKKQKKKGS